MVLGGGGAGVGVEDAVVMELAPGEGVDNVITVNCPDQAGLGSDLCRTILEFGLRITRGGEPLPSTFDLCSQFSFRFFPVRLLLRAPPFRGPPRPCHARPRVIAIRWFNRELESRAPAGLFPPGLLGALLCLIYVSFKISFFAFFSPLGASVWLLTMAFLFRQVLRHLSASIRRKSFRLFLGG